MFSIWKLTYNALCLKRNEGVTIEYMYKRTEIRSNTPMIYRLFMIRHTKLSSDVND